MTAGRLLAALWAFLFLVLAQPAGAAGAGRLKARLGTATAPASDCPPGAVAANLCAVWDLQTTAGATQAALYSPIANADQLPAGTSVGSGPGQVVLPNAGSYSISRFDFANHEVNTRGTTTGTVSQSDFSYPGAGRLFFSDELGSVTIDRSTFDGTGILGTGASALVTAASGTNFVLTNSRISHSAMLSFYSFAATTYIGQSYFSHVGENPNFTAPHLELGRADKGSTLIEESFMDMRAYRPVPVTGVLFFEANAYSGSPIVIDINRSIIDWGQGFNLIAPIQVAARNQNLQITIRNSAIKPGVSGFVYPSVEGAGVNTILDGGGNYNLYTGAPINITVWP